MAKKVYLLRKLRTQCLIVKQAISNNFFESQGHVETTHKLLCFIMRIRMFAQINLRHIKYKMTRLVLLTKCSYVPQASPLATNTVN